MEVWLMVIPPPPFKLNYLQCIIEIYFKSIFLYLVQEEHNPALLFINISFTAGSSLFLLALLQLY